MANTEMTIIQRIFGILIFFWYFFSPEIVTMQEGRFKKTIVSETIVFTILSIFLTTLPDILYFISNYTQRAIFGIIFITTALFVYLKYSGVYRKIKNKINQVNKIIIKNKTKRLREIIFKNKIGWLREIISSYLMNGLRLIYIADSTEIIIREIEKKSFRYVWNVLRIIFLCVMLFDHVPIKFFDLRFGITFLLLATLYTALSMNRSIQKHPLIYLGLPFLPWILYFFFYFICKDAGIKPVFLEDANLVSSLGLDQSNWFVSTVKISAFSSAYILLMIAIWTGFSVIISIFLKGIIYLLKLGLSLCVLFVLVIWMFLSRVTSIVPNPILYLSGIGLLHFKNVREKV